eukprot:c9162_g1_i1.p1 GENE.c9162_g1_i1~~c9162_g1_i1.p1  ORF type:complete len:655 (+),score=213.24 c9162_g1_i1:97-2061(+)
MSAEDKQAQLSHDQDHDQDHDQQAAISNDQEPSWALQNWLRRLDSRPVSFHQSNPDDGAESPHYNTEPFNVDPKEVHDFLSEPPMSGERVVSPPATDPWAATNLARGRTDNTGTGTDSFVRSDNADDVDAHKKKSDATQADFQWVSQDGKVHHNTATTSSSEEPGMRRSRSASHAPTPAPVSQASLVAAPLRQRSASITAQANNTPVVHTNTNTKPAYQSSQYVIDPQQQQQQQQQQLEQQANNLENQSKQVLAEQLQQPISSLTLMSMFPPPLELMGALPPPQQQQQAQIHHVMRAGRPGAPDVSAAAPASHLSGEQVNAQTGLTTGMESTMSSLLGSLTSSGSQVMGSAHTLFTPPYSWMWRVGMSGASLKYDNLNRIAEIPELLSLITGYYASDPEALAAAKHAEADRNDRFSLSNLSQVFGTTTPTATATSAKTKQIDGLDAEESPKHHRQDDSKTSMLMHPLSSLLGSDQPSSAKRPSTLYSDDDDEGMMWDDNFDMNHHDEEKSAATSSWMNSLFGDDRSSSSTSKHSKPKPSYDEDFYSTYGRETKKSAPSSEGSGLFGSLMGAFSDSGESPSSHVKAGHSSHSASSSSTASSNLGLASSLMSVLGGVGGKGASSDPTASMLKMAAPMFGIDPSLANMAAPILSSLV